MTVYLNGVAQGTGDTVINSDTYAGDGGVNTARAHGLGVTPKMVILRKQDAAKYWLAILMPAESATWQIVLGGGAVTEILDCTAADDTNFYVSGNHINDNLEDYYWTAIG